VHATAVTASQTVPRAYNGQLLQLLHALPSGSIVRFVLVRTWGTALQLLLNDESVLFTGSILEIYSAFCHFAIISEPVWEYWAFLVSKRMYRLVLANDSVCNTGTQFLNGVSTVNLHAQIHSNLGSGLVDGSRDSLCTFLGGKVGLRWTHWRSSGCSQALWPTEGRKNYTAGGCSACLQLTEM